MRNYLSIVSAVFILVTSGAHAHAQQAGSAGGQGVIERLVPGDDSGATEAVAFSPHYSFAYSEGSGGKKSTWIVLTDKEPPLKDLMAASDRAEARRVWCEKEKASFVALKLDANWAVDLYFLCPGNGGLNTEMVSSANGLDSVIVKFDSKTDSRLKGSLVGGEGSCPDSDGNNKYCTQESDYTFDAPVVP